MKYKNEALGSLETFDQREILRHLSYISLSVLPSVRGNHDCVRTQSATNLKWASMSHSPVGIEIGLYRSTESGTSHINQTGIPGSWAHGRSDSRQIRYLGLYTDTL